MDLLDAIVELNIDEDTLDNVAVELLDTDILLLSKARSLLLENGLEPADVDDVILRLSAKVCVVSPCFFLLRS
jgi:hypothetical protein